MDNKNKIIDNKLKSIESSLQKLERTGLSNIDTHGQINISTPLYLSYQCKFMLDRCKDEINNYDQREEEYLKHWKKLEDLLGDDKYRQQAIKELKDRLDQYPTQICHFLELDPKYSELEHRLSNRDVIQTLLLEIEETNVESERIAVEALDKVLRCRYEERVDMILEEYSDIERPYYPESFWWRHPSKVVNELG